ncbi:MAG: glycosyltransferase family 4 protein [Kiritimatiellaceae bacterium]|nr:glycosyltransferase family 4 protein [Kiritimatiellaceae bacterium]
MNLAARFLKVIFLEKADGPRKRRRGGQYDVLLAVWNVFRSPEQWRGFESAGLSVHWVGDHHVPPRRGEVTKRSFSWFSFIARMLYAFVLRREWLLHLSMNLFDLFSGTRRLNSRLVWAYVEMNTLLIRRAKKKGIPVVLDNPIAHMRRFCEDLKPEYEALGLEFHEKHIRRWTQKAEEEYAYADWFNVGSRFVKKTLVGRGVPSEKIFVNHTGVDSRRWEEAFKNRKHDRRTMTFVCTAHITPRKGIQYLIKAWEQASLEDAELLICGGGALPWERICPKMPDNIRFIGPVKHRQLMDIYAGSDVYVLPSLLEGFVRSGLEAMASGLPLIITEETGLTDVCSDGAEGWVIPARNTDQLAERLVWCRANPDAVRVAGERAFMKMQGRSFDSYGARCAAIARAIIEGRSPMSVEGVEA